MMRKTPKTPLRMKILMLEQKVRFQIYYYQCRRSVKKKLRKLERQIDFDKIIKGRKENT